MQKYELKFNYRDETKWANFKTDTEALEWVDVILDGLGYEVIICGEWDVNGKDDNGDPIYRMLFWITYENSINDSGEKAICQLIKSGR